MHRTSKRTSPEEPTRGVSPGRRILRVVVLFVATGVLSVTGGSPSWTDGRSEDRPPAPAGSVTSGG